MKNKIINLKGLIAVMIITVLISVSCKKYLSPDPVSTFDPSFVFGNIPNAKAALNGAYFSMAGDFGYGIRVSYYYAHDDDIIMGGGSALDQLRHQEAHYTLVAGNTDIVATFNQFYAEVSIMNETDTDKQQFRLSLIKVVAETISKATELLGIQVPTRM